MFNELRPQSHTRRGIILSESDPKNIKEEKKIYARGQIQSRYNKFNNN